MPRSYTCLHYHIIFSTKDRKPIIPESLESRLHEYIGGILRAKKSVLLDAGGTSDHIHLLASISKELAIADALRFIKSNSSAWIHETFPDLQSFAWQAGYGAFSVSYSGLDAIKRYIANQKVHHRKQTFQEEFVEFLKRHDVECDERYLWD